MKEEVRFSDIGKQFSRVMKPRMPGVDGRMGFVYQAFSCAISHAFKPIRQSLFDGSASRETILAWGLFATWFAQDRDAKQSGSWVARQLFLTGKVVESVTILEDLKSAVLSSLKTIVADGIGCQVKQTLFNALGRSDVLDYFYFMFQRMADPGYLYRPFIFKVSPGKMVAKLVDALFDKLIQGNDEFVSNLFERACGFCSIGHDLALAEVGNRSIGPAAMVSVRSFGRLGPVIRNWFFGGKINLNNFLPDRYDCNIIKRLIVKANPQYPLGIRWFVVLVNAWSLGFLPLSVLEKFRFPYAMDLRGMPLAVLPLNFKIPAPKKGLPNTTEDLVCGDPCRASDRKLVYLRQGYHLINPLGWHILWRQGVRDFSAFRMDGENKSLGYYARRVLDLRATHPETMLTLPACSNESVPLGMEGYYLQALTREYNARARIRLAVFALGLSVLFYYICHCIRTRLIQRLPEEVRPEVAQVLSVFRNRPITRVASDYLNYKFAQCVADGLVTDHQRRVLFGALPDRDANHYFRSMEYVPLFQTRRALNGFIKKAFYGMGVARAEFKQQLINELVGVRPWMDGVGSEEGNMVKDKSITRLLCSVVSRLANKRQLEKQFIGVLVKPKNVYFFSLLFIHYQPIIQAIGKKRDSPLIKDVKKRSRFLSDARFLMDYTERPYYSGFVYKFNAAIRLFSDLFRIVRQLEKNAARAGHPDPLLSSLWLPRSQPRREGVVAQGSLRIAA
jgi:hypothetical protein